jgi:hypothetical protein
MLSDAACVGTVRSLSVLVMHRNSFTILIQTTSVLTITACYDPPFFLFVGCPARLLCNHCGLGLLVHLGVNAGGNAMYYADIVITGQAIKYCRVVSATIVNMIHQVMSELQRDYEV